MTGTLDNLLTALDANPDDLAAIHAAVDCALETDDPRAEDALRAWVCAVPESDEPRLALAEWWEGHGQRDRGEFVRVQIELACLPPETRIGDPWCLRLARNEAYLRQGQESKWAEDGLGGIVHARPNRRGCVRRWEFVRGFIENVEIDAEVFLAHADTILRREPLREVTLTTWPAILSGEGKLNPTLDDIHPSGDEIAKRALRRRFPRVKFILPPVHWNSSTVSPTSADSSAKRLREAAISFRGPFVDPEVMV